VPAGTRATCGRCGAVLLASRPDSIERSLALALAALVLWIVANTFPFLSMNIAGRVETSILGSGVWGLYQDGFWELALLVLLFAIVFPLLKIMTWLALLLPVSLGRGSPRLRYLLRFVEHLHPWAMTEVFLLGVLVSYTKLMDMATISAGPALAAFVGLIVVMVWTDVTLETSEVWDRIAPLRPSEANPHAPASALVGCHVCDKLQALPATGPGELACSRCGSSLHRRKVDSTSRAWALALAAVILYVPANVFPVMTLVSFGEGTTATILGGVIELIEADMLPLALLVFFASITVPMLKLLGLGYLLISVRIGSRWRPRERTTLYRLVESVGRWSMLDIFVLAILAGLVRLGSIATMVPGLGAISFAAVVVLTMFAAMSFDPRLVWDAAGANDDA